MINSINFLTMQLADLCENGNASKKFAVQGGIRMPVFIKKRVELFEPSIEIFMPASDLGLVLSLE